ncbi:hypothetical protein AMTR_s00078p00153600 [Amborella trichopoda]|uniref:Uncharacterized protein n=1 Tax=Amborella trichopoda TaxID=13333 RepID=W1PA31_AMBTC|nr:hypothetical protein AMTR_s00078p00153600 [Amborella trichopoda]
MALPTLKLAFMFCILLIDIASISLASPHHVSLPQLSAPIPSSGPVPVPLFPSPLPDSLSLSSKARTMSSEF